jgi:hypothetical protein
VRKKLYPPYKIRRIQKREYNKKKKKRKIRKDKRKDTQIREITDKIRNILEIHINNPNRGRWDVAWRFWQITHRF